MRTRLISGLIAIFFAGQAQASTTYTYIDSLFGYSPSGSITTDGKLGTLTAQDILSWTFNVDVVGYDLSTNRPVNETVTINSTNPRAYFELSGSALTATTTGLYWNFDQASAVLDMALVGHDFGQVFGGVYYQRSALWIGGYAPPVMVSPRVDFRSGTYEIASVETPLFAALSFEPISPTPLPGALPMFAAVGIAGAGLLRRRKRRS